STTTGVRQHVFRGDPIAPSPDGHYLVYVERTAGDAKVARYHLLDVATNRERFVSDETFLPSSLQPGSAHSPPVPRPLPVRFTSDSRRVVLMTLPPREGTPAEALLVVVAPEREKAVGARPIKRSSAGSQAPG